MSKRISVSVLALLLLAVGISFGQNSSGGTFVSSTPYSVYGVGDIMQSGSSYNASMGGVGVALRSNRFINPVNPASITERDSLSVMADVSIGLDNKIFTQSGRSSASNTFTVRSLMVSMPIWRSSAFYFGMMPYSGTGYSATFQEEGSIIANTGAIHNVYTGKGGMYKLFVGAAAEFWDRVSIGAEYIRYFGDIQKNYSRDIVSSNYLDSNYDYELSLGGNSGRFGLQYEQPLGKDFALGIGATYTLSAKLGGTISESVYSGATQNNTVVDTLSQRNPPVRLSDELAAGISFKWSDKLVIGFDYTRSDWSNSLFDKVDGLAVNGVGGFSFKPCVAQSFRFGAEFTPNRSDIRYYMKRVSYRIGAYYKTEGYTIGDNPVTAFGLTLGATLPVFRWHNGITVAVDLGQRGSPGGGLIRERYVNFTLGINLYDIWFRKPKYE
ncbi:MAG: hypothetical protein IJU69_00420 [Bacteroidales bacterium]|nr:hypothetical protein [Bacteroidales bacterium]